MTGLHEVACGACGKRHVMSALQARSQRVLRCECGQFVRMDRALTEAPSEPAPAPAPPLELADADDDDETHMLTSLEAIAALGSASGNRASRASLHREDDTAAPRVASAPAQSAVPSVPPARPSSPVRRPSSPVQSAALPVTERPLWYVDLGGSETVEMTIQQLIIARRSGKLGEGALVWRAGMPRWRSVGSLIPAAGSGAPRQATLTPPALAPTRPGTPAPLGSYERPLATLEFALEKPEISGPRDRPSRTPSPARPRPTSQPPAPRIPTPMPRLPTRGASQIGPLPAPAPLPPATRLPTPLPPAPSTPPPAPPRALSSVSPLMGRASPRPLPRSVVPALFQYPWRGQRPRWLSIGIAVLICVAASGSGAFLVRALKLRRQPLSLSPTQLNAAPAPASPALAAPATTVPATLPAVASGTAVVDIDSLSVEHRVRRVPVRAMPPATPVVPPVPPNLDKSAENTGSDEPAIPDETPQPATKKAKATAAPPAAHANPDASGTVGDAPKRPAPPTGDEPGF